MKKTILSMSAIIMATLLLTACNSKAQQNTPEMEKKNNILVAYFSATGTTEKVAQNLAAVTNADLFEIEPAVAYTAEDLNWQDKQSRSSVEMADKNSRPAIAKKAENIDQYDTVFLGFPIWWYIAPTIINTYLESGDFSGKTIILFATSGGSGFGKAVEFLQPSAPKAIIKEGKILNGNPSQEELAKWVRE